MSTMSTMSSMRTLTIGDRTISYEAGLESISLASLAPSSGQGPGDKLTSGGGEMMWITGPISR